MSETYLRIKPGERVADMLIRFCSNAHGNIPTLVQLTGLIESGQLTPAPGADSIEITTKAYLVSGTGLIKDERVKLMGTLSWVDEVGESHTAAGRISGAVSGGLHAFRPFLAHEAAYRGTQPFDINTLDAPELQTLPAQDDPLSTPRSGGSTTEMPKIDNILTETQLGWAQAQLMSDDQIEDGPIELQRGDVLLHPRFGACRVVRVPSFGKVKVRRENGAFLDLHMKILHLTKKNDPRFDRAYEVAIAKPGAES